jgi:hypothetical protein
MQTLHHLESPRRRQRLGREEEEEEEGMKGEEGEV